MSKKQARIFECQPSVQMTIKASCNWSISYSKLLKLPDLYVWKRAKTSIMPRAQLLQIFQYLKLAKKSLVPVLPTLLSVKQTPLDSP